MLKGLIATLILDSVADDVEVFIARDARAAGLIYRTYGKKSPLRLSEFFFIFHKRLRIFNRFLNTYYTFLCTLDYKFLCNYLQL